VSVPDRDQRTVKPTPKRIADFRRRGEAARSRDLTNLMTMAGGFVAALFAARPALDALRRLFAATHGDLGGQVGPALALFARTFVACALPAAGGALLGWLLSGVQLGWPPVWKLPGLRSPFGLAGVAQLLSPRAALARVGLSLAKVGAVGGVAALAVLVELRDFAAAPPGDPAALGNRLAAAATRLVLFAGAALAMLAILDYVQKRRQLMARMMMTPAEAKREAREQEGDPQIKRRRRQRMRELAKRRIAAAVKTADVVVVNPTHYAVALRYATSKERAPRVVAKGTDDLAAKIRDLARRAGVPILSRPPLARLIHKLVPEGREIPAPLYKAVAEVLAYVYRLRRRASAR
jgi:flagellar biosynthesis protein FlhB